MHDPLAVAFSIRRPWPSRSSFGDARPGKPRWEWTIHRKHGIDYGGRNPRRWWRPRCWSPFVTIAGRGFYFPEVVTIWHVEPGGRDMGEVCKHWIDGEHSERWRWHVWHWRIQVHLLQKTKRFLFERCIECGHRFPWGYAPVSHQWDGPRSRWFRINRLSYHRECSSLVSLRQDRETRNTLIRYLFDALRTTTDADEEAFLDRLSHVDSRALPFTAVYALTGLLGYERDGNYKLVRKDCTP